MKRLGGRVDTEPDERERAGVGERQRRDRARVENRRQVVAPEPPQGGVAEPREDARVHRDDEDQRRGDPGEHRRRGRSLGQQQRRDDHRSENRERGLIGHARDADAGRDPRPRRAGDAHRGHQQPRRQVAAERRHAPHAHAGQWSDLGSKPVQDDPPQCRVVELGRQQAEDGEHGPSRRESQLGVGELVRLGEDGQHDAHRHQGGDRGEQGATPTGADATEPGAGKARWHHWARHGASLVVNPGLR